ncbi:dihydrolipoyl dehydrogenase [Wenzhouxiangella limi]|uniref:Dihydrolipoyl dehydrogenase n=1 Tax=Wenzhouxiangella limi TaxID=2707351 RepID=A0A845UYZ9_9GAMM|nr:dihydrolipoyl dehydrogenase [Wenzhouxiangella limi]NDY95120.1 dihydrolipoyl dehydrogenase [Wenzhouxiangella limi]
MPDRKVDVAVIGGGTAGMVAYRQARKHTESVVLIEAEQFGTTCARVGCMPSKLLIAAAESAHSAHHAQRFGIHAGPVRVDGQAVMNRVRRHRDRFVGGVLDAIEKIPEDDRILGRARFVDRHTLKVGEDLTVHAGRVVIATGSRTKVLPFLEEAGSRLITSDDIFDWSELPESVVVFGPGVIGLELGQALSRLGVRVRMFGVGGLVGPIRDPEIRQIALETFNQEFPLDADSKVREIRETERGVQVTFDDSDGDEATETFDYLLAATGRRPNVDGLNLDAAELELDDDGMPLFDPYTTQCGNSPVFIAGDANNRLPLLHEAADEGRIAGANAGRWPDVCTGLRRTPLTVVFTDPQIAACGRTLQETAEHCRGCYAVGSLNFRNQGRSRVMGKSRGLLRVYGEHGSGRFMGAEMFGPAAEHIAHLLAWSAQQHMSVDQMLDMPYYHPVIEEGLRTALQDLAAQLKRGPERAGDCMDCGPGA